ncbi:MAG TPA: IclR family transcriptional regulator [Syntrophorhabdales bacterium]|nr:IclR family transcriptional regulator [Syntrophorhabdales bacterium]
MKKIYRREGGRNPTARSGSGTERMQANSLVRGLLVLECFSPHKDNFTLAELSRLIEIPKSSLHRVVKTLSQMNYLRYEEQSKRYYLGTRVLSLGFSVLQSMELREIARPCLEKLSRECNKTVNLAVFDRNEMVYVERVRVPGIRVYNVGVGNRIPLWSTAVGRAVLAHLDQQKLGDVLKELKASPEFNGDRESLKKIIDSVRRDGFATSDQEHQRGIIAIAVPVFSSTGVVCAVNLVGEPEDVSMENLKREYAPKLMKVGKELSLALGYREESDYSAKIS